MNTQDKLILLDGLIERSLMQENYCRTIGMIQGAEAVLPEIEDYLIFIDEYPTEFLSFLANLARGMKND